MLRVPLDQRDSRHELYDLDTLAHLDTFWEGWMSPGFPTGSLPDAGPRLTMVRGGVNPSGRQEPKPCTSTVMTLGEGSTDSADLGQIVRHGLAQRCDRLVPGADDGLA